jgi:phosphoribosylanthranilate isomerase
MMRTRIKICGITRLQDAKAAVDHGADALGFIFWPNSPRYIEPAMARAIVRDAGPFVSTVGVFVNPSREEVERAISDAGISMLQFHGEEAAGFCAEFGRPYIKAFKVGQEADQGADLIKLAQPYESATAWMFDAFDSRLVGGTGETFDWNLIPASLARPLVLSGGLNDGNIVEAIRRVKPFAVDVSSGVEAGKGIKDAAKIAAFIQGVCNADQ